MLFNVEKIEKYYPILMWGLLVAFLLVRFAEPIKDGDVLWHIKYGEYHVQNKTLIVDHSLFSWTPAIKYEPYCTWAADVLFYFLFQAGGWTVLYAFMYLCLFFPVVVAWLFARKTGAGNSLLTFFVLVILQLSVVDASYIKPEILSLVFFVLIAALYFNLKISRNHEKKRLLFLFYPLIFLFWANMHGVFFVGLVLLAAIIVGELINFFAKNENSFSRKSILVLVFSGLLSVVATFLTPYGADLLRLLFNFSIEGMAPNVVNNTRAYQSVLENIWISSVEHKLGFWGIMVVSFLILFFVNAKKKREFDFGILLPTLFLALVSLKYLRASFYWPSFWAMSFFYFSGKERFDLMSEIKNAKPVIKRWGGGLVAGLLIFFLFRSLYNFVYWPTRFNYLGYGFSYGLPFQESAFLKENNIGQKLFNSYNAGSYLIFDLFPDRKVFIDNRYFPYKDYLYDRYMAFRDGQISLAEMESEFGFDTAVVTNHEIVLNHFLKSRDWKPVFYGIGGVVLVHQDVDFQNDISMLDHRRFDGLKNITQAATIVRTAQNLNDLNAADYVINIMKEKLSHQGLYDFFYPYCVLAQKGLRAFEIGDYNAAFDSLWHVGFNDSTIRTNEILKKLTNMKIKACMQERKYQDALRLVARLIDFYRNDEDVMFNAGVVAYKAAKQTEKQNTIQKQLKSPPWRETFHRLLKLNPDHQYAERIKKLLMNERLSEELPIIVKFSGSPIQ